MTDRPLVESWGVRAVDRVRPYAQRRHAQADADLFPGRTVVPLIAADRLTDEALVEVIVATHDHGPQTTQGRGCCSPTQVRAVLAALRAHVEAQ